MREINDISVHQTWLNVFFYSASVIVDVFRALYSLP